ncbi:MAG: hypothetical protein L3K13_05935 [Thermoplasmata archaeon]|nr:hypothetical protein [Thermoplasmata archaeon]
MADPVSPAPSAPSASGFPELLHRLGIPLDLPRRPVIHTESGTLLSFVLLDEKLERTYVGVFVREDGVETVGPPPDFRRLGSALHLPMGAAELANRLSQAGRLYLERAEELDEELVSLSEEGTHRPAWRRVAQLERKTSVLRREIARAVAVAAEGGRLCEGGLAEFDRAAPTLISELERIQMVAEGIENGISNLLLLQNAEMSNRLTALANLANIRMLGLTYLALILALVGAIILFPNTGATILGMPSAAWVPGIWVDAILIVLTIIPVTLLFMQPWLRRMLKQIAGIEGRSSEGLADIPEIPADEAAGATP